MCIPIEISFNVTSFYSFYTMVLKIMTDNKHCNNSHCSGWITINNTFPLKPTIYLLFSLQHTLCHFSIIITLQSSTHTNTTPTPVLPFASGGLGFNFLQRKEMEYISLTWVPPILCQPSIPSIRWATHPKTSRGSAIHVFLVLKMFFPEILTKDKCKWILGFSYFVFPLLSTAINPIILFLFSSNFRHALQTLWPFRLKNFCCSCCKKRKEEDPIRQDKQVELQILVKNIN